MTSDCVGRNTRRTSCRQPAPRLAHRHRRLMSLAAGLAVVLAVVLLPSGHTEAQRPLAPAQRAPRQRLEANPDVRETSPILIETSPSLMNLLNRAEEGIARRDWKFAIDSLQRVIDHPGGSLVRRSDGEMEGGELFESARRTATKRLATLPPEGLRAYRMLYDGKAFGLLERAKRNHDADTLRLISRRYLLTRHGDDATELLASWALDDGRGGEALALLTDALGLIPDADVPEARVMAMTAAAHALLGRSTEAAEIIAGYAGRLDDREDTPKWLDRVASLAPSSLGNGWSAVDATGASPETACRGGPDAPTVMPTLLDFTPWRHDLPGSVSGLWRRIYDDDPADPPIIEMAELASDGRWLFVRKPGGCAALDADDLSVVWESSHDEAARAARAQWEASRHWLSRAITGRHAAQIEDDALAMLSTAGGLVFTIERDGQGEFTDRDKVAPQQLFPGLPRPGAVSASSNTTKLVAYDARTGDIRWQRGRTGNPADPLGAVRFRSTPIMADDLLWIPYISNKDLFVAVLRPDDGALVHNVLLGSVLKLTPARYHATPPAYADGVVYIPSGYGALFAVDASDFTLRWATRYRGGSGSNVQKVSSQAYPWMPSRPVIAGGLVILAATDHEELLAFTAARGEFVWSAPSEYTCYVLGADHARIWLGGRGVSCLSVADGSRIWRTHVPAVPTGRGVLVGDVIHLPMSEGLVSLGTSDGNYIETQPSPPSRTPLGNLVRVGSAVFSLDPSSIRKFPDLERMLAEASDAYESDATNAQAAIRLAWVELLIGEPRRAYERIERIPAFGEDGNAGSSRTAARVRLEALLAMAEQEVNDHSEALKLLESASDSTLTSSDSLRCGLLIAARQTAMGHPVEAYRTLLDLGLGPEAGVIVSIDESVEIPARLQIVERLRLLRGEMTRRQLAEIDGEANASVADAVRRLGDGSNVQEAQAFLKAASELYSVESTVSRTLLALADWELSRQRFERTEQYLLECIRHGGGSPITTLAHQRLCELYAEEAQDVTALLVPCLNDLEERFGQSPLAGDGRDHAATRLDRPDDERLGVQDWIDKARARIPSAQVELYRRPTEDENAGQRGEVLGLTGERAWSYSFGTEAGPLRLVSFTDRGNGGLGDRVVVFGSAGAVECLDATTGALHWRTQLRLPETFTQDAGRRRGTAAIAPRHAVSDGQVAVFHDAGGLFAVGLATGRRLWVRPCDVPEASDRQRPDSAMAVENGLLAAMPRDGRLTLMRMLDGSTVWERDLRGEPVASLRMGDDCVITTDPSQQRVHVLNRADGRMIGQVLFGQPDPDARPVRLIWTGGMLCGPDSTGKSDAVLAVNIRDGTSAWRFEVTKPLAQLFEPQEGYLGVGLLGGDVLIIDVSTGEVVLEQQVATVAPVTDGLFIDGTLVVQTESHQGQRTIVDLTAFDVATGEEIWERKDLTPVLGSPPPLRAVDGALPVMVASRGSAVKPGGIAVRTTSVALTTIDLQTGLNSGSAIDLPSTTSGTQMSDDMLIGPGTIIVGTSKSIQAFKTAPVPAEAESDF